MEAVVSIPLTVLVVLVFVILFGEASVIGRLWRRDLEAANYMVRDFRKAGEELRAHVTELTCQLRGAEARECTALDEQARLVDRLTRIRMDFKKHFDNASLADRLRGKFQEAGITDKDIP